MQAAGAGELTKVMDGVIVQGPDGQLLPVEEDGLSCDWTCRVPDSMCSLIAEALDCARLEALQLELHRSLQSQEWRSPTTGTTECHAIVVTSTPLSELTLYKQHTVCTLSLQPCCREALS